MITVVLCMIPCMRTSHRREPSHVYDQVSYNTTKYYPSYGVCTEKNRTAYSVTNSETTVHQSSQQYDDDSAQPHCSTQTTTTADVTPDDIQIHTTVDQSHNKKTIHSPYLSSSW